MPKQQLRIFELPIPCQFYGGEMHILQLVHYYQWYYFLLPQLPRSLTGHFHWSSNLPLPWLRQSWSSCPWPPIAKLLTDQSFRWFVGFFPADKVHIALALIGHSGLNKNILPSPKCPYVANFNAFFLWGLFNFTIRIPLLQFSIVNPFSWKLEDIFPLLSVALRLGVSKAKDKITSTRINLKLLFYSITFVHEKLNSLASME